jgi:predicted RNA-binding protein
MQASIIEVCYDGVDAQDQCGEQKEMPWVQLFHE